jgi:DNA-directed RNA polymerase specialized sigma24 family protein
MDIFNPRGQRLGQFQVVSYDGVAATLGRSRPGAWEEWLATDGRFTPADAAVFRLDFSAWLASLPAKSRAVAELLATGYGTGEAARLCKVSSARVSQLRGELRHSWLVFQGET